MAEQSNPEILASTSEEERTRIAGAVLQSAQVAALPHFYINGFTLGVGTGDVHCVLQLNNRPTVAINMSFTVAKTIAKLLGHGVAELEKAAGREFLTTEDVAKLVIKKD